MDGKGKGSTQRGLLRLLTGEAAEAKGRRATGTTAMVKGDEEREGR